MGGGYIFQYRDFFGTGEKCTPPSIGERIVIEGGGSTPSSTGIFFCLKIPKKYFFGRVFPKKTCVDFNTKIPKKYFFGHVFPKKRFQLKFLGTGENFFDIFHFLGFFGGLQHRRSLKNGHFWKKTMYYYLYSLFF